MCCREGGADDKKVGMGIIDRGMQKSIAEYFKTRDRERIDD